MITTISTRHLIIVIYVIAIGDCQDAGCFIFEEQELKDATNDFNESQLIGSGSFGKVFKGYLRSTHVAIKLLSTVSTTMSCKFFR